MSTENQVKTHTKRPRISESQSGQMSNEAVDSSSGRSKIFNDSVHGHIEINEVCLAIIDTPQFQRLRFIKQLGFCYYVYPGASHNRFEHSIGVYHLAGELVRSLKSRQPDLPITPKDILCVEIAGLCHDLGHGPHSHMFDEKFMPQVTNNEDWTHEKLSLKMFDHLIEENKLRKSGGVLHKNGFDDQDIDFIKELIDGRQEGREGDWPYVGRNKEKAFLYEIISNKITGIDVDKWDYFARDCHHLGNVNNFDHNRFMKFVRVLNVDGRPRICSRKKEIENLYQMFYTRYTLHHSAYQHKVAYACETMALDALKKANDIIEIEGSKGSKFKISECVNDMTAYEKLTDNILWEIYTSQDPDLDDAKKLMKRLFTRKLYKCLDERSVSEELYAAIYNSKTKEVKLHRENLKKQLSAKMMELSKSITENAFKESDFHLSFVTIDFGKKDKDPLKKMFYYSKEEPNKPEPYTTNSLLFPARFTDNRIRVYSTGDSSEFCDLIKKSFDLLCDEWRIKKHQTHMEL